MTWSVIKSDMRVILPVVCRGNVDAIVCDPPYGLSKQPDVAEVMRHWLAGDDYQHSGAGFMGKSWDSFVPGPTYWQACYDALKPGGHLVAFGGSRTFDLMAVAIRLAGFEIRDTLQWIYGSGFPKSMDVSKAIDKAAGAERERVPYSGGIAPGSDNYGGGGLAFDGTKVGGVPLTPEAQEWEGWGTALKPAYEPIVVARKPLGEKTVAKNVLVHRTGALNIDATRIDAGGESLGGGAEKATTREQKGNEGWERPWMDDEAARSAHAERVRDNVKHAEALGRWPANVVMDEEAGAVLDEQTGTLKSGEGSTRRQDHQTTSMAGTLGRLDREEVSYGDTGGASRFFYCAKTAKEERSRGLSEGQVNAHPTVKPIALMRWLVRLVTPPDGLVLDPFCGSGSTGCAAVAEGFNFIGVDLDESDEYLPVAQARIAHWASTTTKET